MDSDIVVTRTTVALTLAGVFASVLLVAGVVVCKRYFSPTLL